MRIETGGMQCFVKEVHVRKDESVMLLFWLLLLDDVFSHHHQ